MNGERIPKGKRVNPDMIIFLKFDSGREKN